MVLSFRRDTSFLQDGRPARDLPCDETAEDLATAFGRRGQDEAQLEQPRLHAGIGQRGIHGGGQPVADGRRQAARGEEPVPGGDLEARQAALRRRRNGGMMPTRSLVATARAFRLPALIWEIAPLSDMQLKSAWPPTRSLMACDPPR